MTKAIGVALQSEIANRKSEMKWLPRKDSNLDKEIQNLWCYHYTTRQIESGKSNISLAFRNRATASIFGDFRGDKAPLLSADFGLIAAEGPELTGRAGISPPLSLSREKNAASASVLSRSG